jgi:hypothetical protein
MQDLSGAVDPAAASPEETAGSAPATPSQVPAPPAPTPPTATWICPGVPYRRRMLTGAGVALAAAVFFFLAHWQGASMQVSTIIGVLFIAGFIWYLRAVAPTPFSLTVDAQSVARSERGGEPARIAWPNLAKVKEERFKNGKPISLTVYKRVGERGLHRAFVVYRDDIGDFDGFLAAMRAGVPADRPWLIETVHE